MNDAAKIKYFPKSSLKAYDGMSVTADVWDMAHSEHRDALRSHILSMHHCGIICGLEVHANDPADRYVFITPGAAVDSLGRLIVVDQTIAYDFGDEGAGKYILMIGYAEHEKEDEKTGLKIMQHEYIIAARQSLPKQPVVELARLTISKKGSVISDAEDPFLPEVNELDLRYRDENHSGADRIRVAVLTSPSENEKLIHGWRVMQNEIAHMLPLNIVADIIDELDERIHDYDLLYIAMGGKYDFSDVERALISNYYANGKGLILEGLDAEGMDSLKKLVGSAKLWSANPDVSLFYQQPFYFRIPPEQIEDKHILCGKKIVLISDPVVSAWGGELDGEALSREELRSNLEWGANLIKYCAC